MVTDRIDVHSRTLAVFRQVFDDPSFEFQPGLRMGQIEAWDSFNQINLMLGIETEFHIEFDELEMAELLSVEAILEAIDGRLGEA
jgi:hypothetical protein